MRKSEGLKAQILEHTSYVGYAGYQATIGGSAKTRYDFLILIHLLHYDCLAADLSIYYVQIASTNAAAKTPSALTQPEVPSSLTQPEAEGSCAPTQ